MRRLSTVAAMGFVVGQTVVRRYRRGDWVTWVQPLRVVRDDADGLLLWAPVGSDLALLVDADGRTGHELTPDAMREPRLSVGQWRDVDVLILMPPAAAYSVWWFFDDGVFDGWYVNLEAPFVRRPDGVETVDHVLDIVVTPEREWAWKDADELAQRTGHPLYFGADEAAAIRAEGERIVGLIEAGKFPFDGTLTDFRGDPAWPLPKLP